MLAGKSCQTASIQGDSRPLRGVILWVLHHLIRDFSTITTSLLYIIPYLANAKSSSQAIASWSAVWRLTYLPFSVWRGKASLMCSIVCLYVQARSELRLFSHLWRLAKQGPLTVLNLLRVDHSLLGRLVTVTCWVWSDTRCLFGTSLDSNFFFQVEWVIKSYLDGRRADVCMDW